MDKELQAEFDFIILGSNFENSVLAGALSRVGKRVLLIERNSYYGSNNATFCFSEMQSFGHQEDEKKEAFDVTPMNMEKFFQLMNQPITKRSVIWDKPEFDIKEEDSITPENLKEDDISIIYTKDIWNKPSITYWKEDIGSILSKKEDKENINEKESALPLLQSQNRKYNIDIGSSMILSHGDVVEVLAESGLGQYTQFYPLNSISSLITEDGIPTLMKLPCSKQEVFASKAISLRDKRVLAQFIQFVSDSVAASENEAKAVNDADLKQGRSLGRPQNKAVMKIDVGKYYDKPFIEFLNVEFHISDHLKDMIIYSICLAGSDISILSNNNLFTELTTEEGLQRVQEFITSLYVYGTTPFIYPIYGCGDVLQSFCRINNVYAGITMLQTHVVAVATDKSHRVRAVEICNESLHTVIRCKHIVASDDYAISMTGSTGIDTILGHIVHAVYIVTGDNKKTTVSTENSLYGDEQKEKKDLREIIVIPATTVHRAIYLLVLNSEFHMTAAGETVIYAYEEVDDISENAIMTQYDFVDDAVTMYLSQLKSSSPVNMLYSCKFIEKSYKCRDLPENYHFVPTRLEKCYLYLDHRMKNVRDLFEQLCPGSPFLPQTHSSQESLKEDTMAQELSLFDDMINKMEK